MCCLLVASYKSEEVQLSWWKRGLYGVYLKEIDDPNFNFQIRDVEEFDQNIEVGPTILKRKVHSIHYFISCLVCKLWLTITHRQKTQQFKIRFMDQTENELSHCSNLYSQCILHMCDLASLSHSTEIS